jgi:hypothetical protein
MSLDALCDVESEEIEMADFTSEEEGARRGEAVVFWSWIAVLAGGLAYMIAIAVAGL